MNEIAIIILILLLLFIVWQTNLYRVTKPALYTLLVYLVIRYFSVNSKMDSLKENKSINSNEIKFGGVSASKCNPIHSAKEKIEDISHIPQGYHKDDITFSTLLTHHKLPYCRRRDYLKTVLHYGQLKLHLSEVEFLLTVYDEVKHSGRSLIMVYAGAAGGHHINFLSTMFPEVYFELFDPAKFAIKNTDKIRIHSQLFLNRDAAKIVKDIRNNKKYNNPYIMLVSDIRLIPATEEQVEKDMATQLKWWKIMKPDLTMFKFRLPWRKDITIYPEGEIYTQAFPGPTSTETRLIFKKDAKMIKYDNIEYESRCFYHNTVTRLAYYDMFEDHKHLNLKNDGICNCYDCAKFIYLSKKYLEWRGEKADRDSIMKFINKTLCSIMDNGTLLYKKTVEERQKQYDVGVQEE